MRLECRPLVELNTGCVEVHEDLSSACSSLQSSPNQKRRRVVGKQPPPRAWKEIICLMQNMQSDCLIHALEFACEFLPERKRCRELSKECCDVFNKRTSVVFWYNCAPGLTVESLLETLLEEVPHSLKRPDYRLEIECLWHWYTTTIKFVLSNTGTLSHWHTTLPRLLFLFWEAPRKQRLLPSERAILAFSRVTFDWLFPNGVLRSL